MPNEFNIIPFNPNDASEQVIEAYLVFDEKITLELIPEQGLTSKESRKRTLKVSPPTRDTILWLATINLQDNLIVIGYSRMSVPNTNSPDYEQNGHIARCSILILSDYTNKGIGSTLLEKIKEKALEYERVTDLMFHTFNESGYSFLEKNGARLVLEQNRSYLNLSEIDLDLINSWNNLGNDLAITEKIELIEIEGSIPEEILEEYAALYTEIMSQQPLGSLQLRNVTTPDVLRSRAEQMKKTEQHWHTILTIERNGQISGMTEFHYSFNQPDMIFQLLTGVKDKYRKRGLGKWLKARMLLFMIDKYPEAKFIETTNTVSNEAMVSINKGLGFYDKEPLKFYELKIE